MANHIESNRYVAHTNAPLHYWTDPELYAIFGEVAQAAGPICAAQRVVCHFNLYFANETRAVNAYASGNGDVTIMRPLLNYLGHEDEVAFVMGHEIGHHLGQHLQQGQVAMQGGAALGGVLLGTVAAALGGNAYTVRTAMETGAAVGAAGAYSHHSIAAEMEADYIGAYLAARAGYASLLGSRGPGTSPSAGTQPAASCSSSPGRAGRASCSASRWPSSKG
jgi:predicted Zn-dependent protease